MQLLLQLEKNIIKFYDLEEYGLELNKIQKNFNWHNFFTTQLLNTIICNRVKDHLLFVIQKLEPSVNIFLFKSYSSKLVKSFIL